MRRFLRLHATFRQGKICPELAFLRELLLCIPRIDASAHVYICGETEPSRDSSGVNRILVAELDYPFEKLRHEPSLFPLLITNSPSSVLIIRRGGFVFLISHGGDALHAASLLDAYWFLSSDRRSQIVFVHRYSLKAMYRHTASQPKFLQ